MVDKTSEKKIVLDLLLTITWITVSDLYSCEKLSGTGADPGIFDLGFPKCGSERTVELFCGKLRVLNLWTPVAVGAESAALLAEANTS